MLRKKCAQTDDPSMDTKPAGKSNRLYTAATVWGFIGLFGGRSIPIIVGFVIEHSPNTRFDGEGFYRLPVIFSLVPAFIVGMVAKMIASSYFMELNKRIFKKNIKLSKYKIPYITTGICFVCFLLCLDFLFSLF